MFCKRWYRVRQCSRWVIKVAVTIISHAIWYISIYIKNLYNLILYHLAINIRYWLMTQFLMTKFFRHRSKWFSHWQQLAAFIYKSLDKRGIPCELTTISMNITAWRKLWTVDSRRIGDAKLIIRRFLCLVIAHRHVFITRPTSIRQMLSSYISRTASS